MKFSLRIRLKTRIQALVFVLGSLFISQVALAAEDRAALLSELHVGAGISSPSSVLSLQTQPAALVKNSGLRFAAQSEANQIWDDPGYRGAVFLGLDWLGAAGSLEKVQSNRWISRYGIAAAIPLVGLSIGIAGESGVKNTSQTDSRAGLLFQPTDFFRLGFTAVSLQDSVDEYGLGVAMALTKGIAIVVDASTEPEFKEMDLKAGLRLGTKFAGLTASMGTSHSRQIVKGFSAGGFISLGRLSTLEVQYRPTPDFDKYLASLSFGF